jgi:hypothetical protein
VLAKKKIVLLVLQRNCNSNKCLTEVLVRTSLLGLEEPEGDAEGAVLDVPPSSSSCTDDDDEAEDPGRDGGSDVNFLMNEKKSFFSYLNTFK